MKTILKCIIPILVLSCLSLAPSWSAPIDGKLSLESPVTSDRLSDDSSMILGSLSTRLSKRWTLTGTAQYNFGDRGARRRECFSEDKVRGILAYDLSKDVTVYSFVENRFSLDQTRVVLGASYRFRIR